MLARWPGCASRAKCARCPPSGSVSERDGVPRGRLPREKVPMVRRHDRPYARARAATRDRAAAVGYPEPALGADRLTPLHLLLHLPARATPIAVQRKEARVLRSHLRRATHAQHLALTTPPWRRLLGLVYKASVIGAPSHDARARLPPCARLAPPHRVRAPMLCRDPAQPLRLIMLRADGLLRALFLSHRDGYVYNATGTCAGAGMRASGESGCPWLVVVTLRAVDLARPRTCARSRGRPCALSQLR